MCISHSSSLVSVFFFFSRLLSLMFVLCLSHNYFCYLASDCEDNVTEWLPLLHIMPFGVTCKKAPEYQVIFSELFSFYFGCSKFSELSLSRPTSFIPCAIYISASLNFMSVRSHINNFSSFSLHSDHSPDPSDPPLSRKSFPYCYDRYIFQGQVRSVNLKSIFITSTFYFL